MGLEILKKFRKSFITDPKVEGFGFSFNIFRTHLDSC